MKIKDPSEPETIFIVAGYHAVDLSDCKFFKTREKAEKYRSSRSARKGYDDWDDSLLEVELE